jgi:Asp-tRNA(Asn)/Glu-tRNA(Gln) amidotransferase A subunit family amidase
VEVVVQAPPPLQHTIG